MLHARVGWKGLPGTNTLAYNENPQITAVKSFKAQFPRERLKLGLGFVLSVKSKILYPENYLKVGLHYCD